MELCFSQQVEQEPRHRYSGDCIVPKERNFRKVTKELKRVISGTEGVIGQREDAKLRSECGLLSQKFSN